MPCTRPLPPPVSRRSGRIVAAVAVRGDGKLGRRRRRAGALVTANMAAHIRVIGVDVRNCYVRSIAELSSGRIRVIGVDVCFRYPALVRRGAIFTCADTVVAGFAIGGPVAVGVLVDWRCAGVLVTANIAGRSRVIGVNGVDVRSLVLDALVFIRAISIRAFMPVARAVLAPIVVGVLVGGRRDDALVTANNADVRSYYVRSIAEFSSGCIRVIGVDGVDVRGLVLDAFVPIRAISIRAFMPVTRVVPAPVAIVVLMGGRRDGTVVAAGIADHICIIVIEVCFRYPALVHRGAIFTCADAVVAGFTIGDPVAVGVLVDWRCDGVLVTANIAGRSRVIGVD